MLGSDRSCLCLDPLFFSANFIRITWLFDCRNYGWLMLAVVRALIEQQPVEGDYSKFK